MGKRTWTVAQERYLFDHASEGAKAVTDGLNKRFGTNRTIDAVSMYASRHGISLMTWEVCPSCGATVRALGIDGVCTACHYDKLRADMRAERDRKFKSMQESDERAREAIRDYRALKSRIYRERKKSC